VGKSGVDFGVKAKRKPRKETGDISEKKVQRRKSLRIVRGTGKQRRGEKGVEISGRLFT